MRDRPENKESREFLYDEYQGHCQLSGNTFQKAKPNADGNILNYFEVFSLLPYSNAKYLNDEGNMLCVSADMGARLGSASFEWVDDIQNVIAQFKQNGNSSQQISVQVCLAGKDETITWSQRHFMRLVALYEKS